ncbi:hypothetical protein GSH19_01870 [Lactobacillus sp. S2-2]|uniref:hypothetical protein n=1 Tax=Lactobacillus sp. S2-2 TaxID=2692917 RepID=UPI001F170CCB|nr:hypothetical protein [Lactobacillus sp. S2-2]MCF6514910.1 hypothetical protein [Lactobacillus sp. S2-2]
MNILNKNGFNLKFWITLIVNFLGILFANFIIRKIAGTNAYIYGTLAFIVSIALLIYDIIFFKDFIKEEWLKYRKNIWKNIFYSIIVVILVGLTISVARSLLVDYYLILKLPE